MKCTYVEGVVMAAHRSTSLRDIALLVDVEAMVAGSEASDVATDQDGTLGFGLQEEDGALDVLSVEDSHRHDWAVNLWRK